MDYFEPKSVREALSLLAKYGDQAKVIAGGTDVMVDIKYKEEPDCLVNIKKIPGLGAIQENGGSLRIGPLVTIHELETNKLVRERLPVLWEAAHQFASLQIRNTATIGGNVCRASPSGETLAPLLVLEAKGKLVFSDGEKTEAQQVVEPGLQPGAHPGRELPGEFAPAFCDVAVHALRVRPQQSTPPWFHAGQVAFRRLAQAESAGFAVKQQRHRTKDFGELACGRATNQVHLPEPVLRLHVTLGGGEVFQRIRADARHAPSVAVHRDFLLEFGNESGPIEPG